MGFISFLDLAVFSLSLRPISFAYHSTFVDYGLIICSLIEWGFDCLSICQKGSDFDNEDESGGNEDGEAGDI